MRETGLRRIRKSGTFEWPWPTSHGLIVVTGAAGGGGGGGGAFCIQGLNLYGARGGRGGRGGTATTLATGTRTFPAAGGNGGGGGSGGGLTDGEPTQAKRGVGCRYGNGGEGGQGATAYPIPDRTVSNGGDGGRGFPGETLVVELLDLSAGDVFQITIGEGGDGGRGGDGYVNGGAGAKGTGGSVLFVPIFDEQGDA